jgi:hypothetical protein
MTLKQLQDFRNEILGQVQHHGAQAPVAGQELLYLLGGIELQVGLNLVNQLITMEQAQMAAPPGATGPGL